MYGAARKSFPDEAAFLYRFFTSIKDGVFSSFRRPSSHFLIIRATFSLLYQLLTTDCGKTFGSLFAEYTTTIFLFSYFQSRQSESPEHGQGSGLVKHTVNSLHRILAILLKRFPKKAMYIQSSPLTKGAGGLWNVAVDVLSGKWENFACPGCQRKLLSEKRRFTARFALRRSSCRK